MGQIKNVRLFIAEKICKERRVIDIDKAFVLADELWDEALREKNPKAKEKLNRYIREFQMN